VYGRNVTAKRRQVSSYRFQVTGSKLQVPSYRFQVAGFRDLVFSIFFAHFAFFALLRETFQPCIVSDRKYFLISEHSLIFEKNLPSEQGIRIKNSW